MPDQPLAERLRSFGIVPVVEIEHVTDAVPLGRALVDAGLGVIEVTFRTASAAEAIHELRQHVPSLLVGAGTVLDAETARAAANAGAHFLVSPGYNPAVIEHARRLGVPIVPGVATGTEIERVRADGFRLVKFFPAVVNGGIPALTAFAGPYRDMTFMPTGGITAETAPDWLALPSVVACGGTWVAPKTLISSGGFDEIRTRAAAAVALRTPAAPTRSTDHDAKELA